MIAAVALVALYAAGLTLVLRGTLARKATFEGRRPWACDLCMSWWGSLVGVILAVGCGALDYHGDWSFYCCQCVLTGVGAVPVSMLVLRWVGQPGSAPDFGLPPSDGDTE